MTVIKTCPNCEEEVEVKNSICPNCGEEFHRKEKSVKLDEFDEEETDWGSEFEN